MATDRNEVLRLLDLIESTGGQPIIVGGWGVDALVGRETRLHRDLDVLVPDEFVAPVIRLLRADGYEVSTDWLPVRVELSSVDGDRHIDIHPIFDDGCGGWWQHGLDDARFDYPTDALTTGSIAGRSVRCLTVAKQRDLHTGYEPRQQDIDDLAVLDQLEQVTEGRS